MLPHGECNINYGVAVCLVILSGRCIHTMNIYRAPDWHTQLQNGQKKNHTLAHTNSVMQRGRMKNVTAQRKEQAEKPEICDNGA